MTSQSRRDWSALLAEAAGIVQGYRSRVTLRQLFYRLVSVGRLANTRSEYTALSARTAEARRLGAFPDLIDRNRLIHTHRAFGSPTEAWHWLINAYRRDRAEGQATSVYVAVEKAGIVEQLDEWFGHLGVPILALGGYASQSYARDVLADVRRRARPAVLLYAGDFDPSGEDILRDFVHRTGCWSKVRRVALTADQVEAYRLPPQPGKATDTRAARFVSTHGRLVQVELDALDPDVLHGLFTAALSEYWDTEVFEAARMKEEDEAAAIGSEAILALLSEGSRT